MTWTGQVAVLGPRINRALVAASMFWRFPNQRNSLYTKGGRTLASKNGPTSVQIDGQSMIALTEQDYEVLITSRRQLGAYMARMKSTQDALLEMIDLAESLGAALAERQFPTPDDEWVPSEEKRKALETLLGEAHRRIESVRRRTRTRSTRIPHSRDDG
jgi:hypothetical protein